MNYSTNIISDLQEEYKDIEFSYQEIDYEGKLPCFFISVKNEKELADIWMKVSDLIAVNFQAKLNDEFSIWNIYLFFITNEPISNELKYLIENDTFSSRKIIIEKSNDLKEIIDEHILNSDIKIDDTVNSNIVFTPHTTLFNEVADLEVKSRVTNATKDAYSRIIVELKKENNEI